LHLGGDLFELYDDARIYKSLKNEKYCIIIIIIPFGIIA
jgi:hypothetical protein